MDEPRWPTIIGTYMNGLIWHKVHILLLVNADKQQKNATQKDFATSARAKKVKFQRVAASYWFKRQTYRKCSDY